MLRAARAHRPPLADPRSAPSRRLPTPRRGAVLGDRAVPGMAPASRACVGGDPEWSVVGGCPIRHPATSSEGDFPHLLRCRTGSCCCAPRSEASAPSSDRREGRPAACLRDRGGDDGTRRECPLASTRGEEPRRGGRRVEGDARLRRPRSSSDVSCADRPQAARRRQPVEPLADSPQAPAGGGGDRRWPRDELIQGVSDYLMHPLDPDQSRLESIEIAWRRVHRRVYVDESRVQSRSLLVRGRRPRAAASSRRAFDPRRRGVAARSRLPPVAGHLIEGLLDRRP